MTRQIRLRRTILLSQNEKTLLHFFPNDAETNFFFSISKKTFLVVMWSNISPDRGPKFEAQNSRPHSRLHNDHLSPILDCNLRYVSV